jgi:ribonuclease P protein component
VDQRLRRYERLAGRQDYRRCYQQGRRLRTPYYTVYAYHRGGDVSRLGLAVGKAIGIAVVRNRVKRRIRELFRRRKPLLPSGYDLFVRAHPTCATASYKKLDEAWCQTIAMLTATEVAPRVGPAQG